MEHSNLLAKMAYQCAMNKTIVVVNDNSSVLPISNTLNLSSSSPLNDTPIGTSNLSPNSSILTENIASINPFRFSSEYYDSPLGLVYYNYRHYNPNDGRWLSRDPIAEKGGYNLYGFVKNNPLEKWDILGQNLDGWNPFQPGTIRSPYTPTPKNCCPKGSRNRFTNGSWEYRTNEPNGVKPKTNGCSAPENYITNLFYDTIKWNPIFESACNIHDECYGTCGRTQSSCDRNFENDLSRICEDTFTTANEFDLCQSASSDYHEAVKVFGKLYHATAQDTYCTWADCPSKE